MGVLDAVTGWLGGAAGTVAHVAEGAWKSVKSVFIFAASVFDLVGGAWSWAFNGIGWLGDNVIGLAARVLHLIEWLALKAIPEAASWAVHQAVGWARRAIHTVETALRNALQAAVHWLTGAIHKVEHWATAAFRDVWRSLAGAVHWIENVGKAAANLVLHPERLAAWLGGHVIEPFIKWMVSNSAALIVWLVRRAAGMIPALATTIEDALSRII